MSLLGNRTHQLKLAAFGDGVLRILERDEDWNADTFEAIQELALSMKLATSDAQGRFVYINQKQEPKE